MGAFDLLKNKGHDRTIPVVQFQLLQSLEVAAHILLLLALHLGMSTSRPADTTSILFGPQVRL